MFRNKVASLRDDMSAALDGQRVKMPKAVETANGMLQPTETVQAVASAVGRNGGGVLVVTDQRIFHVVQMMGQVKTESVRFDNVDAIETAVKPTTTLLLRHGRAKSKFSGISNPALPASVQAAA